MYVGGALCVCVCVCETDANWILPLPTRHSEKKEQRYSNNIKIEYISLGKYYWRWKLLIIVN